MTNFFINILTFLIISIIGTSCLLIMPDLEEPFVEINESISNECVFELVEIECTIEDNSTLSHAELYVNNELISDAGIQNFNELLDTYKFYWNTSHIEDGLYYDLQVWAYDKNGNIGKSEIITVCVDNSNSMPGASPIYPVELDGQQYQIKWKKTDATDFKKYKLQHLHPWIDHFHFNEDDIYETTDPNDTTFTHVNIDATLINNYYRVVVYDIYDFVTPSSPKFVEPDLPPVKMEINSAEYDDNSIIINWDQSTDFDFIRYELYESYNEDMEDLNLIFTSEDIDITTFIREGIYDNETRYYRLDVIDIWDQKTEGFIKTANAFTRFYKTYGGINDDAGFHVIPIQNQGFIVSGQTESFGMGAEDGIVLKLDLEGNELESFTFGNYERDILEHSIMLDDSSLMFVGRTESMGNGGSDGWIVHSDQFGNLISENFHGGDGNDRFSSIVKTTDGTIAIVGSKVFEETSNDIWLVEIDPMGNLNEYNFGGNDYEFGKDIYPRPIGGYLLLGETRSFGAGGFDIWIVQVSDNGQQEWQRTISGTFSDDYARKLIFDRSGGGYYLLTKEGGNSTSPVCIIKIDLDGNEENRFNFGYTASDDIVDMIDIGQNSDFLILFGTTFKNGKGDLWFLKIDAITGEIIGENIFADGLMDDKGHSIDIVADDEGYILVGESSSYGEGGKDIIVIKTDPYGNTVGYESE